MKKIETTPIDGKNFSEIIDYCPAEISVMKDYEFIFTLEDFMRRRSLLGQTVHPEELMQDDGFKNLKKCLFD